MDKTIVIYGDSLSWGIIPETRNRLPFGRRWAGVLQETLGSGCRVVEENLNGRTTIFEDSSRPLRNGSETVQMIVDTHSPMDLMIIFLGINDFLARYHTDAQTSALGLKALIEAVRVMKPEPRYEPPRVGVIIPPEIRSPKGTMKDKFSGVKKRIRGMTDQYETVLKTLDIPFLKAGNVIELSRIDGVHLDSDAHRSLGRAVGEWIRQFGI